MPSPCDQSDLEGDLLVQDRDGRRRHGEAEICGTGRVCTAGRLSGRRRGGEDDCVCVCVNDDNDGNDDNDEDDDEEEGEEDEEEEEEEEHDVHAQQYVPDFVSQDPEGVQAVCFLEETDRQAAEATAAVPSGGSRSRSSSSERSEICVELVVELVVGDISFDIVCLGIE